MFQYCTITTRDLSSFDTSNVTDMRFMISHCSNLTTIYATSNPDVSKVTQGGAMFDSSSKLKGAISYNVSKITYAYFNFDGYLTKETSSKAPAKHAAEEETSSQLLTGNELNQLIPETATSIVFTDEEAPSDTEVLDLSALQDGSIAGWMEDSVWYMSTQSEDVQILANADSSYMFSNRPELTSIDLSNLDTSNVTDMSSMFENDSSLSKIDLSSLDMSSVEKMDNMFAGCQSLVSIYVLEDPNLSSSSFGEGMFAGCINLAGSISYDSEKTSSEYFCLDGYLSLKEETELDENRNEQLLN
jgi:surface protein